MNVVFFTDAYAPRINGVYISVSLYADALAKLGNKVMIVCMEYEPKRRFYFKRRCYYDKKTSQRPDVKVLRVPADKIIFSKEDRAGRLDQWVQIKHELDKFKPDIVHINTEFIIGYFGLIYARHRHVKSIYTFHTLWEDYFSNYLKFAPASFSKKAGKEFVRFYLKRVDTVIVPTNRIFNVVKEYNIDRPVHILPTGINPEIAEINSFEFSIFKFNFYKNYPNLKNKRILLYVGRIVKEKNLYFLLDVFNSIKKLHPDTALLFVGGGPELEPLKNTVSKSENANSIVFTGYVDRSVLKFYYKLSNIFVFPSITETQGLVTLEAMMVGIPVVAIGEMGTLDVMQGDNGGFMVKNDLDDFTSKVNLLLSDQETYNLKSQEALSHSHSWSIDILAEKLIEIYKS